MKCRIQSGEGEGKQRRRREKEREIERQVCTVEDEDDGVVDTTTANAVFFAFIKDAVAATFVSLSLFFSSFLFFVLYQLLFFHLGPSFTSLIFSVHNIINPNSFFFFFFFYPYYIIETES